MSTDVDLKSEQFLNLKHGFFQSHHMCKRFHLCVCVCEVNSSVRVMALKNAAYKKVLTHSRFSFLSSHQNYQSYD